MIKEFIGERITPQSKYSVQNGVAYENNHLIKDPKKAKKILEKYKEAVEKNWIIRIHERAGYLERTVGPKYVIVFISDPGNPHYVVRKNINAWRVRGKNMEKMQFPFHLECWRGNSERFTRKEAEIVMKNLVDVGVRGVSLEKYHPGLSETYVDFSLPTSDSIENRFELMDFD